MTKDEMDFSEEEILLSYALGCFEEIVEFAKAFLLNGDKSVLWLIEGLARDFAWEIEKVPVNMIEPILLKDIYNVHYTEEEI